MPMASTSELVEPGHAKGSTDKMSYCVRTSCLSRRDRHAPTGAEAHVRRYPIERMRLVRNLPCAGGIRVEVVA